MYENHWEFGGRCVRSVPVRCVLGWGSVGGEEGLRTEREKCEESREGCSVEVEPTQEEFYICEDIDKANALPQVRGQIHEKRRQKLTKYQTRLRCNIETLSKVKRKHTAFPLPSSTVLSNSFPVALTYPSKSSSSSPGGPLRLKNAHKKNSFKLSLLISSIGAPKNHFRRYVTGSEMFSLHSWKSSARSCRVGAGGCTASRCRMRLYGM